MVCDSSLPRGTWPMGRIIDVFPDSAGHVRTARVKTKDILLVRPITKLVLLGTFPGATVCLIFSVTHV